MPHPLREWSHKSAATLPNFFWNLMLWPCCWLTQTHGSGHGECWMFLRLWRMCKNVFSWRAKARKCKNFFGSHLVFIKCCEKCTKATKVCSWTFSDRAQQKLTKFFEFFNMALFHHILALLCLKQVLLLWCQMVSLVVKGLTDGKGNFLKVAGYTLA